jgi:Tol biopolymer transport system component
VDNPLFQFYWVNLAYLDDAVFSEQLLEPYFQFPYSYVRAERILNFSQDESFFLYAPFRSSQRQALDLYIYDIKREESYPISFDGEIAYAQISPDINQILYVTLQSYLYITDMNGSGRSYNTDLLVSRSASFSPDNQKIAFVGEARKMPEECNYDPESSTDLNLYVIDQSQSSEVIQLTYTGISDGRCGMVSYNKPLVWSSDSTKIVYVKEVEMYSQHICMMNLETLEETCYDDYEFTAIFNYDLSSNDELAIDGLMHELDFDRCDQVCYKEDINTDIFLLNLNTGKFEQITSDLAANSNPKWIENEQYITYEYFQDGVWQIFIVNSNGTWNKQVTSSNVNNYLDGKCPRNWYDQ